MTETWGEKLFKPLNYIFLAAASLSMVLPLIHLLAVSLSSPYAADAKQVLLLPVDFTLASWDYILNKDDLWRAFWVTVMITAVGTAMSMLFTVLTAYPLAQRAFLLRKAVMLGIVITMIFNAPLIPFFLTVKALGLLNSFWAYIIPGLIGTFNMIIIRTFLMELPPELDDSARMDGCNDLRILFQIYLPLSKPVLATVSLFYAVGYWNTFQRAVLFIRNPDLWPLQMKLREYLMSNEELITTSQMVGTFDYNAATLHAATIIFAAVPILLVYPYLQKYFIKGALIGSIKG
ncbi:carbohydrate ABC transporter permease [Paenibacillus mucilaginosus]|uniref:Binding-protein-dependent transport systems inner membrane component n=3 Tax=Paenibacillus mucilaginosus TaxID=61624 RepID=H6NEG5_9BACL|nr:carbohydrate ABC transporter permease [Paenibacillus mucilaginosus]AEI42324.1 binding-protein-dependent transport systems inner membrane component [Paenibacillus mucilaginosus KNP414]AFC28108.1 binding-protein-dependent transport systems inner membrane component [Paenibacillus mucilaginosus 3016]AFH60276.1 ABC transporter permease [Paenibacillus mucilaginosus K02]MCG7214280.1 carbohydrate ABC transporter permease [Paenibacillus mucilaginosus]WDM28789.1 carbohydrate ABC transporter permease 